jgi:integrase
MSSKRQRILSGCSVESHNGLLRLRFRALGPDGQRHQIARATGKPDTPENFAAVRRLADLVGAALAAGRTLQEIDAILGFTNSAPETIATAGPVNEKGITVGEQVERWLAEQAPVVRKAQLRDYRRHLRRYVMQQIGHVLLTHLQPADTRAVQAELLSRGLSVKYVRNIIAGSWRAFLRDAAEDGLVTFSVYPHLKWPEWDFPEADPFTSEERRAIIEWFRTHCFRCHAPGTATGYVSQPFPSYHVFVHLLFWSGLRPSEAAGLQYGDLDLVAGRLYVRRSRHMRQDNRPKTRSARRTVELFPETVRLLQALRPLHVTPQMPVFINTNGQPVEPNSLLAHWYGCLRALGIRQRGLYCTKDTFVTTALHAGAKPAWLEQQTGVRYETLRRHYGRWMAAEVDSELQRFAAFDPTLFGTAEAEVLPRKKFAVTGRVQLPDFAAFEKCERGDSNADGGSVPGRRSKCHKNLACSVLPSFTVIPRHLSLGDRDTGDANADYQGGLPVARGADLNLLAQTGGHKDTRPSCSRSAKSAEPPCRPVLAFATRRTRLANPTSTAPAGAASTTLRQHEKAGDRSTYAELHESKSRKSKNPRAPNLLTTSSTASSTAASPVCLAACSVSRASSRH